MIRYFATALFLSASLGAAQSPVSFENWDIITFPFQEKNEYRGSETEMQIVSDDAVSVAWKKLPPTAYGSRRARWDWTVPSSVPPADLTQRGVDRNISLYFVFGGDRATDRAERGASMGRVLRQDDVWV